MKHTSYILLIALIFWTGASCSWKDKWVKKTIEKSPESKNAYVFGYNLGRNTKKLFKKEEDQKIFLIGVYHSIKGKKPVLDIPVQTRREDRRGKGQEKSAEKSAKTQNNKEQGKMFLKENLKKSGVKETTSGLQYKVLKEGKGKRPSAEDTVEVHYRGSLIDGTEFDSSYKRNKTAVFPLNGVIKGWTEGIPLMREGAKYMFYIPSELAYGPANIPGIPPHSTLIFEVELIKVQ